MDANSFIIFIALIWMDSILAGELNHTGDAYTYRLVSSLRYKLLYRYQYITSTSCEAAKVLLWDRIKIGSVQYFNTFHCFRRKALIVKLLTFPPIRHSLHVVLYDMKYFKFPLLRFITLVQNFAAKGFRCF